jgi:hypothetical protein
MDAIVPTAEQNRASPFPREPFCRRKDDARLCNQGRGAWHMHVEIQRASDFPVVAGGFRQCSMSHTNGAGGGKKKDSDVECACDKRGATAKTNVLKHIANLRTKLQPWVSGAGATRTSSLARPARAAPHSGTGRRRVDVRGGAAGRRPRDSGSGRRRRRGRRRHRGLAVSCCARAAQSSCQAPPGRARQQRIPPLPSEQRCWDGGAGLRGRTAGGGWQAPSRMRRLTNRHLRMPHTSLNNGRPDASTINAGRRSTHALATSARRLAARMLLPIASPAGLRLAGPSRPRPDVRPPVEGHSTARLALSRQAAVRRAEGDRRLVRVGCRRPSTPSTGTGTGMVADAHNHIAIVQHVADNNAHRVTAQTTPDHTGEIKTKLHWRQQQAQHRRGAEAGSPQHSTWEHNATDRGEFSHATAPTARATRYHGSHHTQHE